LVFGFCASVWIGLFHLLAATAATVQTADAKPIPTQEGHISQEKQLEKTSRKYQGNAKFSFSDIAIAFFLTGETRAEKCVCSQAKIDLARAPFSSA